MSSLSKDCQRRAVVQNKDDSESDDGVLTNGMRETQYSSKCRTIIRGQALNTFNYCYHVVHN